MRVAFIALALVLSLTIIATPGLAKPDHVDCGSAEDGTGVTCRVELYPTCYSENTVTVEDGYESDGHCH